MLHVTLAILGAIFAPLILIRLAVLPKVSEWILWVFSACTVTVHAAIFRSLEGDRILALLFWWDVAAVIAVIVALIVRRDERAQ